jgi:1-acyl-sn-glycerol-3-phosphate acyltransferase
MLDVFRSVWIWFASAALIILWVPFLAVVRLFDSSPLHLRTVRFFYRLGQAVSRVNPWRLHFSGVEHIQRDQVYVVVSNHQSLADIPLVSHLNLDAKWLAKAELFRFPFVGWMMKLAGHIPVYRNDRRKAAQSLLQAARCLRQHCSLVFFPEGTRSKDGRILPFNDGPFQLAIREQVAVLPLVVEGTGSTLQRSSWIFRGSPEIFLRVLDPEPVDGLNVKQVADLRERVRGRMIAALESLRASRALP